MLVFQTKNELKSYLNSIKSDAKKVGMVPTMGALHQGHASLVARAISENEITVVSIFVNPTQFNNQEDLLKYPQTFEKDSELLELLSKDIIIFAPSVGEMYSTEVTSKKYDFQGLDKVMEGAFREGHFDGVGTIVESLLLTVAPDKAYFGEKDFQQLQIIKKLVALQNIPVEIIGCPILREPNGLAMSSRNERLNRELRREAGFIYETLKTISTKFADQSIESIMEWATAQFQAHPQLRLEYLQISDEETLNPIGSKKENKKYRAFIAVFADGVRLIDNIALN
ncbi:pantoate--beta-alanine ligase [Sediminicola sp. 1XM1-17]|uniref:pantoate--beta-alanine ligase n=1 Tax=Sediminicola sp. 1XM1-17 TaxID=3127702 RepID=UPI0030775698